jgi:hypothetical protein
MTWSSFEEYETPPTPEELYVHHCALELGRDEGSRRDETKEEGREKARGALKAGNPGMFAP